MEPKDISSEEYREYDFCDRIYIIHKPLLLYVGNSCHRVVDSNGITHCVPSPGFCGCVVRWKASPEVSF